MVDHHDKNRGSLLMLAVVSSIVGSLTGLLVAIFRIALVQADIWRDEWISRAHGWPAVGFVLTLGILGAAAASAAWLVERFSPCAAGSGIPHVEAVAKG